MVQAEPRRSSPDGVVEFLDDFWHLIWGTSFVPGESAMWLWEGTDSQTWLLSATDSSATTEVIYDKADDTRSRTQSDAPDRSTY